MSDPTNRRDVLKAAVGLGTALPALRMASAADDPANERPQAGDRFVYFSGDKKGQLVSIDALPLGGPQIMAWPMDPKTQVVRSGSRLNQVVLVRFEPDQLSPNTLANAAEGVVAYGAACSHQSCPVSMWKSDPGVLYCACHGSEYDPKDAAKVVAGPAPRRLATLPLKIDDDGDLAASGTFIGHVGAEKR